MRWLKRLFKALTPNSVSGKASASDVGGIKTKAGEVSANWRFK